MIVVTPFDTAVTKPPEETVTTDEDPEVQDTVALLMVAPFWSLTVAEICWVSLKYEKLRLVCESVIEVATEVGGVGGLVGAVPPSPHARSKTTLESRT